MKFKYIAALLLFITSLPSAAFFEIGGKQVASINFKKKKNTENQYHSDYQITFVDRKQKKLLEITSPLHEDFHGFNRIRIITDNKDMQTMAPFKKTSVFSLVISRKGSDCTLTAYSELEEKIISGVFPQEKKPYMQAGDFKIKFVN